MKNKIIHWSILLTGISLASMAFKEQTLTVAIPANTPYSVEFKHNGEAAGFRLWCDSAIVKNYTATEIAAGKSATKNTDGNYTYQVMAPGMTNGQHSCLMSAIYPEGEQKGEPITVPIGNLQMRPIEFRIIVK